MDSKSLHDISQTVKKSVIASIKNKIEGHHIKVEKDKLKIIHSSSEQHPKLFHIKMLSPEIVSREEFSVKYEDINNINDLLKILEFVEKWEEDRIKDTFVIEWNTFDLEEFASEMEDEQNNSNPLYDRKKFHLALKMMEKRYDCNYGITWIDIENHLT